MPSISRIRLTNIVYENGRKRFNDEIFQFDGENSAIVLENGGGKTVFLHTVLQAILPHTNLGERKIKETLQLENAPAHIGIEWIIHERPRRYMTSAVSLFLHNNQLTSYRYLFEYGENNPDRLEEMPFVKWTNEQKRPANKEEISEYYSNMKQKTHDARTFDTISGFQQYVEANYQLIHHEWKSMVKINQDEGGIEAFFANCKTTTDLFDRLLIPTVEDAIAGHETNMFADMFDKQREGLEMYRNLLKSMEEHRKIQGALQDYVAEFKQYDQAQIAYGQVKQQAKGLNEQLTLDKVETEKEQAQIEANITVLEKEEKDLKRHEASLEIVQSKHHSDAMEMAYQEKSLEFEALKDKLTQNEKTQASLLYAKYRNEKVGQQALITQLNKEIAQQDASEAALDYEQQLTEVKQALHGYFLTEIETLNKAITNENYTLEPLKNEQTQNKKEMQAIEKGVSEKRITSANFTGMITKIQSEMEGIRQAVLGNPEQEHMKEKYELWVAQLQTIEEDLIDTGKQKKDLHYEQKAFQTDLEQLQEQYAQQALRLQEVKRDEAERQQAEEDLKEQLITVKQSWQAYNDLYLKEATIGSVLYDQVAQESQAYEQILIQERVAHRFLDDYGEMNSFFADAYVSEKIKTWQNEWYITTGSEYVADLPEEQRAAYQTYPLWALSLITTATDKHKLIQKINEIRDRLQYPIQVLTLEEATQINEQPPDDTWIAPTHYETNLSLKHFTAWKSEMKTRAGEMTAKRKEISQALTDIKRITETFEQFFTRYPKTYQDTLLEKLATAQETQDQTEKQIESLKMNIQQKAEAILETEAKLKNLQEQKNGLEGNLDKATKYMQLEKEVDATQRKQQNIQQEIFSLEKAQERLRRAIEKYQHDIDGIRSHISELKNEIKVVTSRETYQEVATFEPNYTDQDFTVLMNEKDYLTLKLHGIEQQYGELKAKREYAEKEVNRAEAYMQKLQDDNENIDTEMAFPADGEIVLQRTENLVKQGKKEADTLSDKVHEADKQWNAAEKHVQFLEDNFYNDFPEQDIATFEMALDEIPSYLKTWKTRLKKSKSYAQDRFDSIHKTINDMMNALQELEKYDTKHRFNNTSVQAQSLTEQERMHFAYKRMTFTKKVITNLELSEETLNTTEEKIDDANRDFSRFCDQEITEYKLRKMARDGVDTKQSYEGVLTFQKNMITYVNRADDYAREHIRNNDAEVKAFINSIHNHLINVCAQLKDIPKNTRVKVADNRWKYIYAFQIPEWNEEDGKERIRNYLDWILAQLETDKYKDDNAKARKAVEGWLHTKQLLRHVMDNQMMKASCLKVTNNNQVRSRMTSWEESNKWSGGEKWSKNMTLFRRREISPRLFPNHI